jgi:bifunctional DNA-binding transcriptional regulator/antitoxin component of YhaV-PrlF toxin-antitoxin module
MHIVKLLYDETNERYSITLPIKLVKYLDWYKGDDIGLNTNEEGTHVEIKKVHLR